MTTLLEKHLFQKAEAHAHLQRLCNQWKYDKELVPKALKNVGNLFPHYSQHEQSHSEQILVNIERILGEERISLLSATDTWLLLESAYWHDIGMVVPREQMLNTLHDEKFADFIKKLSEDRSSELHEFAKTFNFSNMGTAFIGASHPLDAFEQFRWLMAEWFRQQHPKQAENIIIEPWQSIGVSSPRTELIPARLFQILGRVCAIHGESFESLLSSLSYRETGMANDDCHPRFIACMLRLGDLFDIEDNRFCPVMQRIAGESRPNLSKAHEDKHRSLKHFRLDSERIEIDAVCQTLNGYIEQWRWMDYIEQEVHKQSTHWADIAPRKEFGLLPTLGKMNLQIHGKELINPGERPQFKLSHKRIMNLLKGDNLYTRLDMLREIIQNAVDATMIRIWLESLQNDDTLEGTPEDQLAQIYLKKYPIHIELARITSDDLEREQTEWQLSFYDQGVGISLEDLKYISMVGSSQDNISRQNIINAMPEWLRPSGTFGLGLQSLFMWTDKFQIQTKSYITQQALDITFYNPNSKEQGLIEITQVTPTNSTHRKYGSYLSFCFFESPDSNTIEGDTTQAIWKNYDPLLDKEEPPLEIAKIWDSIYYYSSRTPVPTKATWLDKARYIQPKETGSQAQRNSGKLPFEYINYFPETHSFFSIRLKQDAPQNNQVFFRGQEIQKAENKQGNFRLSSYFFFEYFLDIYDGKASEWLTFDRSRLTDDGIDRIDEMLERNLILWIQRNEHEITRDPQNCAILSALAKLRGMPQEADQFWINLSNSYPKQWLDLNATQINPDNTNQQVALKDILKKDAWISWEITNNTRITQTLANSIISCQPIEGQMLLDEWCKTTANGIQVHKIICGDYKTTAYELLSDISDNLCILASKEIQANSVEQAYKNIRGARRLCFPFELLPTHIDAQKIIPIENTSYLGAKSIFEFSPSQTKWCLLPFEISADHYGWGGDAITLNRFEEFIDWVEKQLKSPTPREEIKAIYEQIIDYFDNDLMQHSNLWQTARKK